METWMHSVLRLAFRQGQDDPKQPKSFQVAGVRNERDRKGAEQASQAGLSAGMATQHSGILQKGCRAVQEREIGEGIYLPAPSCLHFPCPRCALHGAESPELPGGVLWPPCDHSGNWFPSLCKQGVTHVGGTLTERKDNGRDLRRLRTWSLSLRKTSI